MMLNRAAALLSPSKIALYSLLLFLFSLLLSGYQQRAYQNQDSILRDVPDVDELDYHFMAVNLTLKNEFPVIGYLADTADYKIRYIPNHPLGVDVMYLNMLKTAGPVTVFARPPLFSFLVGMLYKIFGVHLSVLLWFNIFLFACLTTLLAFTGWRIWHGPGYLAGLAGVALLFVFPAFSFVTMDLEIFAALLFLLLFYAAWQIVRSGKSVYLLLFGVVAGLEMLNRPSIIFVFPFFLLYYYFSLGKPQLLSFGKKMIPLVAGILLMTLPWSFYINQQKNKSVAQREAWAKKITASLEQPVLFNSIEEIRASDKNTILALRNFIKLIYIHHAQQEEDPILVTNQFRKGISLLFLNNEYVGSNLAGMGSFGWPWKVIRNSYYHTHHLDASPTMKVIYFYLEHPWYIIKIPYERMKYSAEWPLLFWLAPALWAMVIIGWRIRTMKNKVLRWLMGVVLAAIAVAGFYNAFVNAPIEEQAGKVLMFLPLYAAGAWLALKNNAERATGVYPVFWFSIFCFLIFVFGDQRFTKIALPVNCIAIAYFTYLLAGDIFRIYLPAKTMERA